MKLEDILKSYKTGEMELTEVLQKLKDLPFADIGIAKLDTNRRLRTGFPEVIYCPGKDNSQLEAIVRKLDEMDENIFLTRVTEAQAELLTSQFSEIEYDAESNTLFIEKHEIKNVSDCIIPVLTAGTADIPVAAEAVRTIEVMGHPAEKIYDVGVAGIHRFFAHKDRLDAANVVVVVAGMDGVLPSIVGGLIEAPVIAVPTSTGYGASFGGLSALLTMMNSCAPGVAVVNINNGFGAGYMAAKINE